MTTASQSHRESTQTAHIMRQGLTVIVLFVGVSVFDYQLRQFHKRAEVQEMDLPLGSMVESLTRTERALSRLEQILADTQGDPDEQVQEIERLVQTLIDAGREKDAAQFLRRAIDMLVERVDVGQLAFHLIRYYEGGSSAAEGKPGKGPASIWKKARKRDADGLQWVFEKKIANINMTLKHNPREHWNQLQLLTQEAKRLDMKQLAAKLEVEQRNVFSQATHW
ncbi:MAG: hypothetical protein A3K19_07255 [Lentisphaerae bacterium RIFOXYB12_FULL_65_16]|nr:MAG: hypothetical protein A3K18_07125 [Lentisphaerae bacterium RIFOXYA12_64_32]OGV93319.1 MAG: hypothetical protein A3K19_07255 [Lentisphaerae bacterium RIFOXYB12_FULL_65_16]